MFINEYDILIDKILDNLFNGYDISENSKINLEKDLRNSNKYVINIDKLNNDKEVIQKLETLY